MALVDDEIIGVLAVKSTESGSWIDQLYIHPEHCGRGVGSQLMTLALTSLRRPIRLYTFQQNKRSRRFYERFGFSPVEWGDGSKNEEGCPDVLYELINGVADDAGPAVAADGDG